MDLHSTSSIKAVTEAFGLFAALFGAPLEKADIEAIRQPIDAGGLAALARIATFRSDVATLTAIVRGLGDAETALVQLNRAFCLLFLGAGGIHGAAPYESAYRCSGRLYQEPAGEMMVLLAQRGRQPAEGFPEAPDHLVIELALLEEALAPESGSPSDDDAATAKALIARLRHWVPDFAAACRAHDPTGFYAGAADLLVRLLGQDIDVRGSPHSARPGGPGSEKLQR